MFWRYNQIHSISKMLIVNAVKLEVDIEIVNAEKLEVDSEIM